MPESIIPENIVVNIETLGDLVEMEESTKPSAYTAWLEKHTNLTRAQILAIPLIELANIQKKILEKVTAIPKASGGS